MNNIIPRALGQRLTDALAGLDALLDRISINDPDNAAVLTEMAATLTRLAADFADAGTQRDRDIAARLRALASRLTEAAADLREQGDGQ
jgi:hypothetical protein